MITRTNVYQISYMLIPALRRKGAKRAPLQLASVEKVLTLISGHFNVSEKELKSKKHYRAIAYPRQVAMYLIYKYCIHSLAEVGRQLNRHHTTVIHAQETINDLMQYDPVIKNEVERLELLVMKETAI